MKNQILQAAAANLREFGYPDATAGNVTTTYLFASFAKQAVEDFREKANDADRPDVVRICDDILREMQTTIDAGPPSA